MNKIWIFAVMSTVVACGSGDSDDPTTTDDGIVDSDDTTFPAGYDLVINQEQIGVPTWSIEGAEMFVAPMEAASAKCVLEPNHRFDLDVWLPNDPHPEPYTDEFTDAVDSCGFEFKTALTSEDFSAPSGVFLGLMLIGGGSGSTPDYDLGTFIAADRFPMVVDGDVRRDLIIVDNDQDRTYPNPVSLGYAQDGFSHVPLLFQMNVDRMPGGATPPGNYTFRLAVRDSNPPATAAGYDLEVPFTVD